MFIINKNFKEPFALVQAWKEAHKKFSAQYKVRPGASDKQNDQIARENFEANKVVYESWVEFKITDIEGQFVNVTGQVRNSKPAISDSNQMDPLVIFFLGGSTMFGYNVADEETIPSYFVAAYQKNTRKEIQLK